MEAYKYFPVANDRMGIIWTLSSIKDACIVDIWTKVMLLLESMKDLKKL